MNPDPLQNEQQSADQYVVHHNDKIIGFFDNYGDASNAMSGYMLGNQIQIDDTIEILTVNVPKDNAEL